MGAEQLDVQARLARIEAIEDIRVLKAHYCDLCDEGYDPDKLTELFTDDGVWDGGEMGVFEGRERIHRFFANMPKVMSFAIHHVTNSAIEVSPDGNSAKARWYLLQTATLKNQERAVLLAGRYDDELVRLNGVWKFRNVAIQTRFFSPFDEGWAQTPNMEL